MNISLVAATIMSLRFSALNSERSEDKSQILWYQKVVCAFYNQFSLSYIFEEWTMYSKQSLILLSISVIVFALFAGGCSWVTTYGREPVKVGINNVYEFSIYYNTFATKDECDVKAKEEADKFMKANNYVRYTIQKSWPVYKPYYKYVYRIQFFLLNQE